VIISLIKKFLRTRRAATAVAMAIMTVPLLIGASAAVDFARIASARTLLQASVDSAAVAGAGAYQTSQSFATAQNVAQATYSGTGLQLPSFVTVNSSAIGAFCSPKGTAAQCGATTNPTTTLIGSCPAGWTTTQEYCVVATASVTLKNSLFAALIPSEALSATAVATTSFPPLTIKSGNFGNTAVGFGSSLSGIYAYVVPPDANGDGGRNFGSIPTPNTNCESTSNGPISSEQTFMTFTAPAAGDTQCNFLLIGENANGSLTGSLTIQDTDPIAFSFVNDLGERNTPGDLDATSYNSTTGASTINSGGTATGFPTELYVNGSALSGSAVTTQTCNTTANDGSYCTAGYTVPAGLPVTFVPKCTFLNIPAGCTATGTTGVSSTYAQTPLVGECPSHNLYGSINTFLVNGTNIVPPEDSLATYSSAFEVLGFPPTHTTNHALTPFLGPVNTQTFTSVTKNASTGNTTTTTLTYKVQAVCPQWPTAGTNISASGTFGFIANGHTVADSEKVQIYSTYYPDQTFSDGVSGDIFPPAIAGCAPVTSATAATPNASTTNPWWGWSPSNVTDIDPNNNPNNLTDCTSTVLNSGKNGIATTKDFQQSATYNNCAFLIQPLGTDVPLNSSGDSDLPDYYSYTVDPTAFAAGKTGNASGVIAMFPFFDEIVNGTPVTYLEPAPPTAQLPSGPSITVTQSSTTNGIPPGFIQVKDTNAPGTVPGNTNVRSNGDGTFTVTEPPASSGTDDFPPQDTSHQCYNPQATGSPSGTFVGDTNNNTPKDPVGNPQLGVVFCGASPPPSYGLYWNNLGDNTGLNQTDDDLGYANAITVFTCPTPSSTSGGGPSTLSG
jgi:Flp pilus assembly protein TadG